MFTYSQAFYDAAGRLQSLYDHHEATAIAHEVLGYITRLDRVQRLLQKDTVFDRRQQELYEQVLSELIAGRPLQYIMDEAWFMGRPFKVNENVLIPRPETEELVQWILDDNINKGSVSILDIGTGSGCIPVSLKLALPASTVTSCDISADALITAGVNAASFHADIQLMQLDFLDFSGWAALAKYDVIVSNPPYIPLSEKEQLHKNVIDFEPALALFVPDEEPLIFYKAIAAFGKTHLNEGGYIYCELHKDFAGQTQLLFEAAGYSAIEIRKDMHSNLRMLKASLD